MTVEEFATVWRALHDSNHVYGYDELVRILVQERRAWAVVEEIRHKAGLSEADLSSQEPQS